MKYSHPILHIALNMPVRQVFDYLPPTGCDINQLKPGMRLWVPFGQRKKTGLLLTLDEKTTVAKTKLKNAIELIDTKPLMPKNLMVFNHWISQYYQHTIGEVMLGALPKRLREGKPADIRQQITTENTEILQPDANIPVLTDAQKHAINTINKKKDFSNISTGRCYW